ncbi:hypothetical protein E2C01_004809 [Portunus trituberculatus]|uniref:Uncharacterized protein n=1 Tax=Portunus trituberculatus TaxID=210409 RepID=A0A5B7CTB6_PORTR|nr:hypothetical protein [Portunus trituberculatus]
MGEGGCVTPPPSATCPSVAARAPCGRVVGRLGGRSAGSIPDPLTTNTAATTATTSATAPRCHSASPVCHFISVGVWSPKHVSETARCERCCGSGFSYSSPCRLASPHPPAFMFYKHAKLRYSCTHNLERRHFLASGEGPREVSKQKRKPM